MESWMSCWPLSCSDWSPAAPQPCDNNTHTAVAEEHPTPFRPPATTFKCGGPRRRAAPAPARNHSLLCYCPSSWVMTGRVCGFGCVSPSAWTDGIVLSFLWRASPPLQELCASLHQSRLQLFSDAFLMLISRFYRLHKS